MLSEKMKNETLVMEAYSILKESYSVNDLSDMNETLLDIVNIRKQLSNKYNDIIASWLIMYVNNLCVLEVIEANLLNNGF